MDIPSPTQPKQCNSILLVAESDSEILIRSCDRLCHSKVKSGKRGPVVH